MEIKQTNSGTYTLKGLDLGHLEVMAGLLYITQLGESGYADKAADLAILLERFGIGDSCEVNTILTVD